MRILNATGLTYDDLLIIPQYSAITSRDQVDVSTTLGNLKLKIPIIAANMDTICEYDMAKKMGELGGLGIMHRFAPLDEQISWVQQLKKDGHYAVPSVGCGEDTWKHAEALLKAGADSLCLDLAHANSANGIKTLTTLLVLTKNIIFGNIIDERAVRDINAQVFKIGIGPGSACETRIVAGVGMPQATAVMDCAVSAEQYGKQTIADGGIRYPADVAKAIGLGANAVMVGGLFAGTWETPPRGKKMFRGMASSSAQMEHRGVVSNDVAEGATFKIEGKGSVEEVVKALVGGLRSAMSYSNSSNIATYHTRAVFMKVSPSTIAENHPHFKAS